MRIKIECAPPLSSLKAWFIVPPVSTVSDLKHTLCSDIACLRDDGIFADQISLSVDGFELLDTSPVDVVRDGDLVSIKKVARPPQNKRKVEDEDNHPRKRAKPHHPAPATKRINPTLPVHKEIPRTIPQQIISSDSSSDSDSESSAESDSDTSSSDSDSDSESSDSTSSSSSDSSAPSEEGTRKPNGKLAPPKSNVKLTPSASTHAQKSKSPTNHVPPGHGKPATQNRNARRRLKKQFDRLAASGQLDGVDGTNAIPLGQRRSAASASMEIEPTGSEPADDDTPDTIAGPSRSKHAQPNFMMASLSNKNKRKGFKQAMASTLPKKIIFASSEIHFDQDADAQNALPFASVPSSELEKSSAQGLLPRLVPPSEKQEKGLIPANMIVTSVDVEEGMWPARRKGKKQQQARPRQSSVRTEVQEVEDVVLDYGEGDADTGAYADNLISTQREPVRSDGHTDDWNSIVAAKWDLAPNIRDASQVSEGSVVAWKQLYLNPTTYSPELFQKIARITSFDSDRVCVKLLVKPPSLDEDEGENDTETPTDEETWDWPTIISSDWRVIR